MARLLLGNTEREIMSGKLLIGGNLRDLVIGGDEASRKVSITNTRRYVWPFDGVRNAIMRYRNDSAPPGPPPLPGNVTVTIPSTRAVIRQGAFAVWELPSGSRLSLGRSLTAGGVEAFLAVIQIASIAFSGMGPGTVLMRIAPNQTANPDSAGPDFSTQMETSGTITLTASNGSSVTLTGISDSTEPYFWRPANFGDIVSFFNTIRVLTDKSLTITFNDNSSPPLPFTPNGVVIGGGAPIRTEGWHELTGIADDTIFDITLAGTGGNGLVELFPQPNTE